MASSQKADPQTRILELDKHRIRPDHGSGRPILDLAVFTLDLWIDSRLEKCSTRLFYASKNNSRLEWFQLGRCSLEMRGRQFDPRDARVFVETVPLTIQAYNVGEARDPRFRIEAGVPLGITGILVSIHLLMLLVRFLRGDDTGLRDRPR
jgi:hypothetical protein